jgi:ribosomal protein L16/L10AE
VKLVTYRKTRKNFELGGIDEATARLALTKASKKLPVATKIITKNR